MIARYQSCGVEPMTRSRQASSIMALLAWSLLAPLPPGAAERINHEGRILGAVPAVTNSLLFKYASGRCSHFRAADLPSEQRLERRHLTTSVAQQFRGDDHASRQRSQHEPAHVAAISGNELRHRSRPSAARTD